MRGIDRSDGAGSARAGNDRPEHQGEGSGARGRGHGSPRHTRIANVPEHANNAKAKKSTQLQEPKVLDNQYTDINLKAFDI